ncbi:serine/threonine-protein kinase [Aeromicrobium sp.]|uniref:serine/threonine-protein kinase n=1 Tax=Aeromicrobium sp. TaxID=1871063 RepID=UPI003D6B40A5
MSPRTIAGRYVVERPVGRGGMGTVWLCRDKVLGRTVAVKEVGSMPGTSTSDLARALREARNAAALNDRNVVSVYDAVEDGDHNWLVMEYVPSRNLSEVVAEDGALPPERVAWIGAQAADGLAAAHERGTVHRDVKPGNILVTEDDHVKITDFGIARTRGDAQVTRSGIVTGTPAFFAPELAKGEEPTVAADVWALGASLYTAVEGRLPYPDQINAIALLTRIASEPPPPAERAGFLAEPIKRMMDPDPSTRWSMTDVAHTLHRLSDRHGARGSGSGTVSLNAPVAAAAVPAAAVDGTTETDDGPATEATPAPVPDPTPVTVDEASAPAGPRDLDPAREDSRNRGRRSVALAVVVLLVALAAVGAVLLMNRDDGNPPVAKEPTSSANPDSGKSGDSAAPDETSTASEPGAFVEEYYSHLPDDTETAWTLFSPGMQKKVGGYGAYEGFWRTISDVRVDGTTLVKKSVVDVRVTYTSDRGTETETRRLRLKKNGDTFVIAGDEVV